MTRQVVSRLSGGREEFAPHAPDVQLELVPGDVISDSIALTGVYKPAVTGRIRPVRQLSKLGTIMARQHTTYDG